MIDLTKIPDSEKWRKAIGLLDPDMWSIYEPLPQTVFTLTAPGFSKKITIENRVIVSADAGLSFMIGWNGEQTRRYCQNNLLTLTQD